MSLLQLFIIAIVQGLTEWLPISSSGHVLLAANYFTLEGRDELLINAVSNLGTLAAMLFYFRKDAAAATIGGFELIGAGFKSVPQSRGAKLALCIIVATPIAVIAAVESEPATLVLVKPMVDSVTPPKLTAMVSKLVVLMPTWKVISPADPPNSSFPLNSVDSDSRSISDLRS